MEPLPFWKDLRADFLGLAAHAQGFRVIYTSWRRSAATYGECVVRALGVSIDGKRAYPTWCYHPVEPPRLIVDAAAQVALLTTDARWSDSPYRDHDSKESDTPENRAAHATIQRLGAPIHEMPLQPADVSIDDLCRVARTASQAAASVLDEKVRYVLTGGPLPSETESLHAQFRSYATRGALGADLVTADASGDDASNAWLRAMRQERSDQEKIEEVLETPCQSAAALCEKFATEAYRRTRALALESKTSPPSVEASGPESDALAGGVGPTTVQAQGKDVRFETDRGAVMQAVFKRRNKTYWLVVYGDERSETVLNVRGMDWISHLLASPRQAVTAVSVLVNAADQSPAAEGVREAVAYALNTKTLSSETDAAGRVGLAVEGRRSYQARIEAIREEIDSLDPHVQQDRISELRDEEKSIAGELLRAKGAKSPASNRERARKAAAKQYGAVLKTLEHAGLRLLAAHIRSSIRPGHEFEYLPQTPISWEIG